MMSADAVEVREIRAAGRISLAIAGVAIAALAATAPDYLAAYGSGRGWLVLAVVAAAAAGCGWRLLTATTRTQLQSSMIVLGGLYAVVVGYPAIIVVTG